MNKFYTFLLTVLMALSSTAHIWASDEDFSGKILSLGSAATSLETGKWYYLYNQSTGHYVVEGSGNTLTLSATSPNGLEAISNLGYWCSWKARARTANTISRLPWATTTAA